CNGCHGSVGRHHAHTLQVTVGNVEISSLVHGDASRHRQPGVEGGKNIRRFESESPASGHYAAGSGSIDLDNLVVFTTDINSTSCIQCYAVRPPSGGNCRDNPVCSNLPNPVVLGVGNVKIPCFVNSAISRVTIEMQ